MISASNGIILRPQWGTPVGAPPSPPHVGVLASGEVCGRHSRCRSKACRDHWFDCGDHLRNSRARGMERGEQLARQHVREAETLATETERRGGSAEEKWRSILNYVADYGRVRSQQGNLLALAILAFTITPVALGVAVFQHWGALLALLPGPIIGGPLYQYIMDRLKWNWEAAFTEALEKLQLDRDEICWMLPRIETDERVEKPLTENALRKALCRHLLRTA